MNISTVTNYMKNKLKLLSLLGMSFVIVSPFLFWEMKSPKNKNEITKNQSSKNENKLRKDNFTLLFLDAKGNPINGKIKVIEKNSEFQFGGALNPKLFSNNKLSAKCLSQANNLFNGAIDESMFIWEKTEKEKGKIDFSAHKKTTEWAKKNNKKIRHHTLFWENPEHNPKWVLNLNNSNLERAISDRINYTAKELGDDISSLAVVNEMIAFKFYRERLGSGIIKNIYSSTKKALPNAKLYINEAPVHLCRLSQDCKNIKNKDSYLNFILTGFSRFLDELRNVNYDGIGLQAHLKDTKISKSSFSFENKDSITLYEQLINKITSITGKKVLISEFDFETKDEDTRAQFVKNFYTMAFNNKNVEGILYWGWLDKNLSLVNSSNCELTKAGKVYNDLINKQWKTNLDNLLLKNGEASFSAYYGDYEIILDNKYSFSPNLRSDSQRIQKIIVK